MSFDKLPDHELLKRCQTGNQKAYHALFSRYFESMYRYTLKYIRNHAVAEELAMDVLFRFWQRMDNLSPDTNLPAYLFTSAKNALADHWRKKELATVVLMEDDVHLHARPADYELDRKETEVLYKQSVDTLSPQCREVFILSRELGLTYPQIAQEMNLSVNTVKSYMTTALKGLRIKLQHQTDLTLVFALACLANFF